MVSQSISHEQIEQARIEQARIEQARQESALLQILEQESALLQILELVDWMPLPEPDASRRGRAETYPLCLFLKATLIMIAKRLNKVHELLQTLAEPTKEMQRLRNTLTHAGKMPSRRTFERRLARLTLLLPELIARLGACLVDILKPFAQSGRAAALDSTVLRAKDGAVWHKKHQLTGEVPHSRIDTQAGWTKSGWHGGVYGWKLHLACTVGSLWIPLAACLTPADVFDGEIGPTLVACLPAEIRFVLGDQHKTALQRRGDASSLSSTGHGVGGDTRTVTGRVSAHRCRSGGAASVSPTPLQSY